MTFSMTKIAVLFLLFSYTATIGLSQELNTNTTERNIVNTDPDSPATESTPIVINEPKPEETNATASGETIEEKETSPASELSVTADNASVVEFSALNETTVITTIAPEETSSVTIGSNQTEQETTKTLNATIIDLYDNSTLNSSMIASDMLNSCNPICVEVNKSKVLAICLSVFGALVIIGLISYIAFFRKHTRGRQSRFTSKKPGDYTPVPATENIYMESVKVPEELEVEKV